MQNKGKNVMMFLAGKAIALATEHTLSITPSIDEQATKDDAYGPAGTLDYSEWSMSCKAQAGSSGVTNEQTIATLLTAMLAKAAIACVFDAVPSANWDEAVPSAGWSAGSSATDFPKVSGQALITELSLDAGAEGIAEIGVTCTGVGTLTV